MVGVIRSSVVEVQKTMRIIIFIIHYRSSDFEVSRSNNQIQDSYVPTMWENVPGDIVTKTQLKYYELHSVCGNIFDNQLFMLRAIIIKIPPRNTIPHIHKVTHDCFFHHVQSLYQRMAHWRPLTRKCVSGHYKRWQNQRFSTSEDWRNDRGPWILWQTLAWKNLFLDRSQKLCRQNWRPPANIFHLSIWHTQNEPAVDPQLSWRKFLLQGPK